ncbi:uncharacterized protein BT62DRAFT_1076376 [Guyanagaster necrorhizus]|uniref:Uncharacterized protein n=1 Tax=Guyanagaster necrorhizus TaxID=856835 RepID=A0A9P7VR83_9AGAR|nr:uncharacterized protein BT62DRAFT_1076376 [Guyanagaster necrorhizus MCA 3950]KAG7445963.1 hypothetical protein BT62DRAFT_1076376 [Guyanagaster necrorhizus MCA 3950]
MPIQMTDWTRYRCGVAPFDGLLDAETKAALALLTPQPRSTSRGNIRRDAFQKLKRVRHDADQALHAHRIAVSPIRRLPPEILSEFFLRARKTDEETLYAKYSITKTRTDCHTTPPSVIRPLRFFRRPSIVVVIGLPYGGLTQDTLFRVLFSHSHQWRVYLEADCNGSSMWDILRAVRWRLSMLRKISFRYGDYNPRSAVNIFEIAPQLMDVTLIPESPCLVPFRLPYSQLHRIRYYESDTRHQLDILLQYHGLEEYIGMYAWCSQVSRESKMLGSMQAAETLSSLRELIRHSKCRLLDLNLGPKLTFHPDGRLLDVLQVTRHSRDFVCDALLVQHIRDPFFSSLAEISNLDQRHRLVPSLKDLGDSPIPEILLTAIINRWAMGNLKKATLEWHKQPMMDSNIVVNLKLKAVKLAGFDGDDSAHFSSRLQMVRIMSDQRITKNDKRPP